MKCVVLLSVLVLMLCVSTTTTHDFTVGTSYGTHLVWQEKISYIAIPFKKRVKEVFFTDPAQSLIKGIIARDLDQSSGGATITAGGVGYSFVNVRFKSARGSGLNYQFEVYA